jgi:hypothetical protein
MPNSGTVFPQTTKVLMPSADAMCIKPVSGVNRQAHWDKAQADS